MPRQDSEFAHLVGVARTCRYPRALVKERARFDWCHFLLHVLGALPFAFLFAGALLHLRDGNILANWRSVLLFGVSFLAMGTYRLLSRHEIGPFGSLGKWEQSLIERERRFEDKANRVSAAGPDPRN